jgi:hypothetical protein
LHASGWFSNPNGKISRWEEIRTRPDRLQVPRIPRQDNLAGTHVLCFEANAEIPTSVCQEIVQHGYTVFGEGKSGSAWKVQCSPFFHSDHLWKSLNCV